VRAPKLQAVTVAAMGHQSALGSKSRLSEIQNITNPVVTRAVRKKRKAGSLA